MKKAGKFLIGLGIVGGLSGTAYATNETVEKSVDTRVKKAVETTESTVEYIKKILNYEPYSDNSEATSKNLVWVIAQEGNNQPAVIVIKGKDSKVVATENVEGGNGDTTQTAVNNFLAPYFKDQASQSINFKNCIKRLKEQNNRFPTAQKLKDNNAFDLIETELKNKYALVRPEEKKQLQKIADFYNSIYNSYGMSISDLAKAVVAQDEESNYNLTSAQKEFAKKYGFTNQETSIMIGELSISVEDFEEATPEEKKEIKKITAGLLLEKTKNEKKINTIAEKDAKNNEGYKTIEKNKEDIENNEKKIKALKGNKGD